MSEKTLSLDTYRERFRTLSLRKRVGLLAGVGVGLIVVLISIAAYVTVRSALLNQLDASLLNRAEYAESGVLGDPTILREVPVAYLGAADVKVAMITRNGGLVLPQSEDTPPPMGLPERKVAAGLKDYSARTDMGSDGHRYRVIAVPSDENPGLAFVMAQSMDSTQQVLRALGLVLFFVGGGGVLLAAWSGFEIGRVALRPVQRLTAAAEHVARTGDLRPIPVEGEDELARLAHSFNAMLGALAEARSRERRLVADAGHELRTPLTSLRTNLDLLAQSENRPGLSPDDRAGLLDDVRAQITELSALVGDLVELSREDPPSDTRAPLDLAVVTAHALERVQRRAPTVHFDVELRPWTVIGDAQTLERAVTNLLDNAAKWTPSEGTVTVRLRDGVLSVADEGPGIAEVDLPHVFERFYRSAEARTMPGSGLGLSIVKQAVERHGGYVQAGRAPGGGALFVLRIPGMSDPRLAQP